MSAAVLAYILYRVSTSGRLLRFFRAVQVGGEIRVPMSSLLRFLDPTYGAHNLTLYASKQELLRDLKTLERLGAIRVEGGDIVVNSGEVLRRVYSSIRDESRDPYLVDLIVQIYGTALEKVEKGEVW